MTVNVLLLLSYCRVFAFRMMGTTKYAINSSSEQSSMMYVRVRFRRWAVELHSSSS